MEPNQYNNVIEETRKLMIYLGLNKGFQDVETIKVSQELDRLLNVNDSIKKAR